MYIVLVCLAQAIAGQVMQDLDEDTALTPYFIRKDGYQCTLHYVVTADGYILEIQEITGSPNTPRDRTKLPVLLQHGLLASSVDWVFTGPNISLAYILADQGYDVWLGNARGTVYSRKHVTLSSSEPAFWDFSWHEMGYYDVPAVIDHILRVTGHSQILYVGHSMGTTMFFVMCSTRPEYNAKVRYMEALAPIAFLEFTTSPIRLLVPIANEIALSTYVFTDGQFKTDGPIIGTVLKPACEQKFQSKNKLCTDIIYLTVGVDPYKFNETLTPKIVGHAKKDGSSTNVLLHYAQLISSGKFQQFNHGPIKNSEIYQSNTPSQYNLSQITVPMTLWYGENDLLGDPTINVIVAGKFQQFDHGPITNFEIYQSNTPPQYNLSQITVPMALWYGENDMLGDPTDVKHLCTLLQNDVTLKVVEYTLFNHLDFMFADDVKNLLNRHILNKLNSIK